MRVKATRSELCSRGLAFTSSRDLEASAERCVQGRRRQRKCAGAVGGPYENGCDARQKSREKAYAKKH